MLELFEEEEILDVLTETFRARSAEIGDHAANAGAGARSIGIGASTDSVEFLRGLDETERALFRVAHDSAKDLRSWTRGEASK